jgi:subtilisin family serine protease
MAHSSGSCTGIAALHFEHTGRKPSRCSREDPARGQPDAHQQPPGRDRLDSIPDANTYLLKVPALPVLSPVLKLLGVEWIESNRALSLPRSGQTALLEVPWNNSSAWYGSQPALQMIRKEAAQQYSTGRGIIIADINSRVDFGHPALSGHLGAGYDFVANRASQGRCRSE